MEQRSNMSDNPYAPPGARVSDVTVDAAQELASRGARLGGAIVDSVISLVVVLPAVYMMGYLPAMVSGESGDLGLQLLIGALSLGLYILVNGYLLATSGQTIGKRIAGTRIVSVTDGRILPLVRLIALRSIPVGLAGLIPVIGTVLSIADVLMIFRADRRCAHDLIAGTKVVRADAGGSLDLRATEVN
jgi:uncharacterized RDD family membrane protein YckC